MTLNVREGEVIKVIQHTENRKLGDMACTYAPGQTCPGSCPIREECYGQWGPTGIITRALSQNAFRRRLSSTALANIERDLIGGLNVKGLLLRVHVAGDCPNWKSAYIIGQTMRGYEMTQGAAAWTFTHGWREYTAGNWCEAKVLASCESLEDIASASKMGYSRYALVVGKFEDLQHYDLGDLRVTLCSAQVGKATCASCLMCANEAIQVIVFEAHGTKKGQLMKKLRGGCNG